MSVGKNSLSRTYKPGLVRLLTPPSLSSQNLGRKILCHRPLRHGFPCLHAYYDKIGNRYISHQYGHGGAGWTLAPGSSRYSVNQIENLAGRNLQNDSQISIIGAGIIGLMTAFRFYDKGYKNITVIAANHEESASHEAGGLVAPISMDNTDSKQADLLSTICKESYLFYKAIAQGSIPSLAQGVQFLPVYFLGRHESGLETYVGHVMRPAQDVTVDFGTGITRSMVVYDDGILVQTKLFLAALKEYLKGKVHFVTRHIDSLEEIQTPFIMNCTGMGAAHLVSGGDSNLVSVQGHLITLKDQDLNSIQYMLSAFLGDEVSTSGFPVRRAHYMFPKLFDASPVKANGRVDAGVFGGTFIVGTSLSHTLVMYVWSRPTHFQTCNDINPTTDISIFGTHIWTRA